MTPFPRPDYAALDRYDPGRRPVDVDLSDNTNLWGTHPAALARIRAASTDDLARYPELYADTLRDAVAVRFGVDAACVTTGAGSDDVLDSTYRAAWGSNAMVSYASPTFSMVPALALMNGMRGRPIPWTLAHQEPARLLQDHPALVYVCRPNNPTGEQATREWIDELLTLRGASGPLILIDEAYADFAEESLIPLAAEHPGVIVARTTSKAYGLAGLRCGFAVGTPDTIIEIDKSRGPYKVSHLASEAAAAAMQDEDGWMAETIRECLANRARLTQDLAHRGLSPRDSRANFILFDAWSGSAQDDADALRSRGVAVRPFVTEELPDTLRVSVGPWPMMEAFLDALDEATGR